MTQTGMIHGRFQPFHNGHFQYLMQALSMVDELIVGITNPDFNSALEDGSDSHRHLPNANPFSYYLRMQMIRMSILRDEILRTRISDVVIVPFPINVPELWEQYIPMRGVVQLMKILDPWDMKKREMFQAHGFQVVALGGGRLVSGTEIRQDMESGNSYWHQKVPLGTLEVLERWLQHSTG